VERFAPAKVNLFLHVGAPTADGYHPICSLMVFADVGDTVRIVRGGAGLTIEGPFAEGLAGGDNLVLRARDLLLERVGRPADFGLVLTKALPLASGVGGGSSDAAATLRLVRDALELDVDDAGLREIGGALGSDVPACVDGAPVLATGRGDVLASTPPLPHLSAVLVNPGVPSPTAAVYRAYDQAVSPEGADMPLWPPQIATTEAAVAFLAACRNDLEAPAVRLNPRIGEALAALAARPEALLTRMSGSGATCWALCVDPPSASNLAARLTDAHPGWWIQACVLGRASA
jgi:4-diphosphocytidyl-2-C-methyl-D-erythritol kinase